MDISNRELCPNCIELIEVIEEKKVLREEEVYLIEKAVRYCCLCHQELANTINLRFKHKMG